MKPLCIIAIALFLSVASFAQSEDPDIQQLDSLAQQQDSLPDNRSLMQALDSLSVTHPQDRGAILQIGVNDLSAGRIAEALAEFDKAVQQTPDDPRALSLKGKALTMLGRHAEALPTLSRAIELDPRSATTRLDRAGAYNLMNNPEAALQDLQSALASDPTLKQLARTSPNFQSLHDNPDFKKLVR